MEPVSRTAFLRRPGWKEVKGSADLRLKIYQAGVVEDDEAKGYEEGVWK